MKTGIAFANIGPFGTAEGGIGLATAAEAAGIDSLWTVEHVIYPDSYGSTYPYDESGRMMMAPDTDLTDPLTWLTWVGAHTSTIRLATGILILPERNPVVLAKQLGTMDSLTGGRIDLGIGVGWLREEFEAIGVPFERRGQRADETIAAMRALWAGDDASYDGELVNFAGISCNPKPVQQPLPIIIGGHSEAAARRAGRLGNGFFPATGWDGDYKPLLAIIREEAKRAGRDPGEIQITTGIDPADPLNSALRLADMGIDRVVVPTAPFRKDIPGGLERFAAEVIAPLRERLG